MATTPLTPSQWQAAAKLAHALPTASTSAAVRIGHVQLRDLVHSTGPRGRVAYVADKAIKEVDVHRGVQSTRTLAALEFQPNCIALSPSGRFLVAGGQHAELQFSTVAPPPHPSLSRRRTKSYGPAVSDERCKARKSTCADDDSDEESDEEVDESMGWSMDGSEATRSRRVEVRGNGYREVASINNHVLVLGDHEPDGGIYGQGHRDPEQTRILVSNNDEYVRVIDVDTRESAGKEWGSMEVVGSVKLGTPANHVSISPDGRTMLAVGDDSRLQIFNIKARSSLVDFDRIGSYTSGTEPNFTSAWSASGMRFASASQDGTVTVWDVRSSRPLVSWRVPQRSGYRPRVPGSSPLHSPQPSTHSSLPPSYTIDPRYAGAYYNTDLFHWDPSTPGPGHGIRSLRFSPAEGDREVLVFAEHTSHVHVVDATTFSEHQVLDVPRAPRVGPASPVREALGLPVAGADCGYTAGYYVPQTHGQSQSQMQAKDARGEREVDLTGVTFDRTGRWMYVGTERTVVEFEMVPRRGRTFDSAEWA